MHRLTRLVIAPLVAACAAFGGAALSGCYGEAYLVDTAPPPPRHEVVIERPGYVYVYGHWARRGAGWHWQDGHYERARRDQVYVRGRWERRGNSHVWIQGGWRSRG